MGKWASVSPPPPPRRAIFFPPSAATSRPYGHVLPGWGSRDGRGHVGMSFLFALPATLHYQPPSPPRALGGAAVSVMTSGKRGTCGGCHCLQVGAGTALTALRKPPPPPPPPARGSGVRCTRHKSRVHAGSGLGGWAVKLRHAAGLLATKRTTTTPSVPLRPEACRSVGESVSLGKEPHHELPTTEAGCVQGGPQRSPTREVPKFSILICG